MKRTLAFVSWGLVDQASSSIANVGISLVVLHTSSASSAVQFSVGWIVWSLALSACRSITSEPYAVFGAASGFEPSASTRVAHAGVGLVLGLAALAAAGVLAPFSTGIAVPLVTAGALAVASDAVRTTYLVSGAARTSALCSVTLLIGVAAGAGFALAAHDAAYVLVGWGIGSALVIASQIRRSALPSARQFLPETWTYFAEFLLTTGAAQGAVLVVTAWISTALALSQRVGGVMFGPYLAFFQASALIALPLLVQWRARTGSISRFIGLGALTISAALILVLTVWSAVAFPLLSRFGSGIFPGAWQDASALMPLFALAQAAYAVTAGIQFAVRASGSRTLSLRMRLVSGVAQFVFPVVLSWMIGVDGFYLGIATGSAVLLAATIVLLTRRRGGGAACAS